MKHGVQMALIGAAMAFSNGATGQEVSSRVKIGAVDLAALRQKNGDISRAVNVEWIGANCPRHLGSDQVADAHVFLEGHADQETVRQIRIYYAIGTTMIEANACDDALEAMQRGELAKRPRR